MLRVERTGSNELELGSRCALETSNRPKASMLYHVLPAMVQNRIASLPSIRHSISDFRTRASHGKNDSLIDISLPATPPPGYSSRPASGTTTPYRPASSSGTSVLDFEDDVFADKSTSSTTPAASYETSTGINWQHARYGMMLLSQAQQQSSVPFVENDEVMTDIIRSQYLHSITLLLKSLPTTLTPAEQVTLRAAIPQKLLNPYGSARPNALIPTAQPGLFTQDMRPRTRLQRATAWIVFRLFVLIQILIPYIRRFIRDAAQFEEEHQITRRMFNTSVTLGSSLSRECWKVTQAICQMNNGAVGVALSNATIYCAEGVTGGIQQGIVDALRSQEMRGQHDRRDNAI